MFTYIVRSDHWLLFINGLLLMGVCVLPFPTALVAQYFNTPNQFVATLIYAIVFTYSGAAYFLLWNYAAPNLRLLDRRLDPAKLRMMLPASFVFRMW